MPNFSRLLDRFRYRGLIAMSPKRLITAIHARRLMKKFASYPHAQYFGNYAFDPRPIDADSVVYSFGIGRNVTFDKEIAKAKHCKVHLFDVSSRAIEFAREHDPGDYFVCELTAVWLFDGESEMYGDIREGELEDASFTNQYQTLTSIKIPCRTITTIMKDLGHDRIDLLKMDIEGAALPVLLHLLENTNVRPHQLGVELERPRKFSECLAYWKQLRRLVALLNAEGYTNYCKTFKQGRAIEMLSVRN